jgi:hypothetical protein
MVYGDLYESSLSRVELIALLQYLQKQACHPRYGNLPSSEMINENTDFGFDETMV